MNLLKEATSQIGDPLAMETTFESLGATNHTHDGSSSPSHALAPVNRLPPEILVCVFRLSTCLGPRWKYHPSIQILGQHHSPRALIALTHVCAHWRAVVINTASFWSHLPIDAMRHTLHEEARKQIETYFERAQDQAMCVQFDGRPGLDLAHRFQVLAINLHPYLGKVGHLHFVDIYDHSAPLEFFTFWLVNGRAGSVHSLVVWLSTESRQSRRLHSTVALSQGHEGSFLLPIRVLRLNGAYFDWANPAYHNLLILEVGSLGDEAAPTLKELLDILAASPQLQFLRLANMPILPCPLSTVKPVILSDLKHLGLRLLDPEALSMLLPMIILPSRDLRVSLQLVPSTSAVGSVIQSFLSSVSVTRLDISCGTGVDEIASYLSAVPNLCNLFLDLMGRPGDNLLGQMMSTSDLSATQTPLCPNLDILYVVNGPTRKETVQHAVKAHPLLKQLILVACIQESFDVGDSESLLQRASVEGVKHEPKLGQSADYWYNYKA